MGGCHMRSPAFTGWRWNPREIFTGVVPLSGRLALGVLAAWLASWASPLPGQQADQSAAAPRTVQAAQAETLVGMLAEPVIPMKIDPERSLILHMKRPVTRVSVTNPEILEVVQFSPTDFELIGMLPGRTSLTFWFGEEGEMLRYLVEVSTNQAVEDRRKIEYAELERKINELFPNSRVQLIPVANKLIVKGQARDAEEAAQIMAVIRGQGPDQKGGPGAVSLNQGIAA